MTSHRVTYDLSEALLAPGEVAIIGAGPGDPGLLSLRALALIEQADCLVFDRLVSKEVLALASPDAQRFYVGKASCRHALPQEQTNALLVRLAGEGERVVRLKGGDPYIFGRGGEEAEILVENGIPFRVVPGITSAQGCAAYGGFPLTHRDHAQSVTFVTGHCKGDGELALNWQALAAAHQTVVFYMGLANAALISQKLQACGLAADHPVALVERGTTPEQRQVITCLGELVSTVDEHDLRPPTLIVVGDVVRLAEVLAQTIPEEAFFARGETLELALERIAL